MKFSAVRSQKFIGVLILFIYIFAVSAASFHSHSDSVEHLTCKLCHVSSTSGTAERSSSILPMLISDQPVFISKLTLHPPFLFDTSSERAPPLA